MSTGPGSKRIQVGRFGEQFTAEYLERCLGWAVQRRNWRCRAGEIDIVAQASDVLVAVEVRTRTTDACGTALESLDARKLSKLRMLMPFLLRDLGVSDTTLCTRVDVVALSMHRGVIREFVHVRDVLDGW